MSEPPKLTVTVIRLPTVAEDADSPIEAVAAEEVNTAKDDKTAKIKKKEINFLNFPIILSYTSGGA